MRERNIDWLPLLCALTGDWTCNPGMCPDQESNWRPFTLQDEAQLTEPHQSGLEFTIFYFILFKYFIYFTFRERGREGEREGEKHLPVASHTSPTRDLAWNPGMCPDQESNWWPFTLQNNAQPTEPHWSGLKFLLIINPFYNWFVHISNQTRTTRCIPLLCF